MSRSRRTVRENERPVLSTGNLPNTGPLAAAAWLAARELVPTQPRWFVELALEVADRDAGTRFLLEIYSEEWGFRFRHAGRSSWIRVTDVPFVHGRDEHELLRETPKLREIGQLVRALETRFEIALLRDGYELQTNLVGAEAAIATWVKAL